VIVEVRLARDSATDIEAVVIVANGDIALGPMSAFTARELARELEARAASLVARTRHRDRIKH
jgi:hypothetical protein